GGGGLSIALLFGGSWIACTLMLMTLTWDSSGCDTDEPCPAFGRADGHSDPCLCGDRCVRAGRRAIGGAEGHDPAPDGRLDLGRAHARGRAELVFHSYDPDVGPVQPDPFVVDPDIDHTTARGCACAAASRRAPSPSDDEPVYRRAGHRWRLHVPARPHHACG